MPIKVNQKLKWQGRISPFYKCCVTKHLVCSVQNVRANSKSALKKLIVKQQISSNLQHN